MKQRDAAEKNSRQPDAMPGALSQLLSIFDRGGGADAGPTTPQRGNGRLTRRF